MNEIKDSLGTLRIDYGDSAIDIVEGLSGLIEPYKMKFEFEEGEKDGFEIVHLVKTK